MKLPNDVLELWDELLQQLPLPTRDSIRASAEMRAAEREEVSGKLTFEDGVRSFVESVPSDLRSNLERALNLHGIDPGDYEDAFSA